MAKLTPEQILEAARGLTSQHADAADKHRAQQVSQHLDHLEKRQVLADEMSQVMEQKGTGYV